MRLQRFTKDGRREFRAALGFDGKTWWATRNEVNGSGPQEFEDFDTEEEAYHWCLEIFPKEK